MSGLRALSDWDLEIFSPQNTPSLYDYFSTSQGTDHSGIQFAFRALDACMQSCWGIVVQDGHCLLRNDGARIHSGIHQVHAAASNFNAMIPCLFPGFESWERRQK
jgi:hypothetical protein